MASLAHFAFGFDYSNMPAIEFAEKLIAIAPDNITKVRFATGGGEADDHALQLARCYHYEKGNPEKRKILVHRGAYHGGTMGGVELAGGKPGVAPESDNVTQQVYDSTKLSTSELSKSMISIGLLL